MRNLTDDMYAFLAECWRVGLSTRQIALDFPKRFPAYRGGTSKNAIIGIAKRARDRGDTRFPLRSNIGRPRFHPKHKVPKPPKIKVAKAQVPITPTWSKHGFLVVTGGGAPKAAPAREDVFAGTGGKPLAELNAGECHWPIGDGTPQWFCGATITHGQYCELHFGLSRRVGGQRR